MMTQSVVIFGNRKNSMTNRALLCAFLREVVHPSIEREKAATATQPQTTVKPTPAVAATKTTSAKQSSTQQGYRVTDGSRKGRVIGHDGAMNKVRWDDGTESMAQGSELRDISESALLRGVIAEVARFVMRLRVEI